MKQTFAFFLAVGFVMAMITDVGAQECTTIQTAHYLLQVET